MRADEWPLVAAIAESLACRDAVPADAGVWLRASEGLSAATETGMRLLRTTNLGCRRSLLFEVPLLRAVAVGAREGIDVEAAMLLAQAAGALGYRREVLSKRPARV